MTPTRNIETEFEQKVFGMLIRLIAGSASGNITVETIADRSTIAWNGLWVVFVWGNGASCISGFHTGAESIIEEANDFCDQYI